MRTNPKAFPIVSVSWADHYQETEDDMTFEAIKEKADDLQNYIGDFAGRLVYENDAIMVICPNVWNGEEDEENFSLPMFIMKRAIIHIE